MGIFPKDFVRTLVLCLSLLLGTEEQRNASHFLAEYQPFQFIKYPPKLSNFEKIPTPYITNPNISMF